MQININADSEIFINKKLLDGDYASPAEIIDEAIRLLKEKDIIRQHRIAEINSKLEAGMNSLRNGHFYTEEEMDAHFAEKFVK